MKTVLLVGLLVVAIVGVWRRGWLRADGAAAATGVGAAVLLGAGSGGLALLLLFFVTSSGLTGLCGRWSKPLDPHTGSGFRLERPGNGARSDRSGRRARQVLANGGPAALAALCGLAGWLPASHYAVMGTLAAATADTWASELGTAIGHTTRRVTTWDRVAPGSSGGISLPGSAAGAFGALVLAGAAGWAFSGDAWVWLRVGFAAGVVGMSVDSLLGSTVEGRWGWFNNDVVNLGGTLTGAVCAWLLAPSVS